MCCTKQQEHGLCSGLRFALGFLYFYHPPAGLGLSGHSPMRLCSHKLALSLIELFPPMTQPSHRGLIRVDSIIRKLESVIRFFWLGILTHMKSPLVYCIFWFQNIHLLNLDVAVLFFKCFSCLLQLVWVRFLSVITRVLTDCNFLHNFWRTLM